MILPGQWTTTDQLLALAGITGLVGGVVLLAIGRKGRRLDDHPVCRKCGFDLFGKPESSLRCAECGADLNRRRAVGLGNRLPRTKCAWTGAMLAMLSLAAVVWPIIHYSQRFDLIRRLPLTWLMRDVDSVAPAVRDPAVVELVRRTKASELSMAEQTWLIGRLLATHPHSSWSRANSIDAIVLDGIRLGWASDSQLDEFARQWDGTIRALFTPSLRMKPRLRRNHSILLALDPTAIGRLRIIDIGKTRQVEYSIAGIKIDDTEIAGEFGRPKIVFDSFGETGQSPWELQPRWEDVQGVSDGSHSLSVQTRVSVWLHDNYHHPLRFDQTIRQPVELFPRDAMVDKFIKYGSTNQDMERRVCGDWRILRDSSGGFHVSIGLRESPLIPMAMDIRAAHGNSPQQLIGKLLIGRGGKIDLTDVAPEQPKFVSDSVDLILTPSQDAADSVLMLDSYWGDPITIRDVPVLQRLSADPK